MNQGDDFETLSQDLTLGGKPGDVAFGTLTTISESPITFGMLYVGSDDGLIHVSSDVGKTWKNISAGLPKKYWVTRVIASQHSESRVYAALNGYRWDNYQALIYVSDDYGKNWRKIGTNLPAEPVNVIKEDPTNENLLYVGTDHGLYASLDQGISFMTLGDLPKVAVHDVVVHPRENELVVGTHGRSIYIGNVAHLQQLDDDVAAKSMHLFDLNDINYSNRWGSSWWTWGDAFEPSLEIPIYLKESGVINFSVLFNDQVVASFQHELTEGLSYLGYNLALSEENTEDYGNVLDEKYTEDYKVSENGIWYLRPGKYTLKVEKSGETVATEFEIKAPRERPKRKE